MSDNSEYGHDDEDLVDFLQSLDESSVEVTEWESKFIASNLDSIKFSPAQRESIENMINRYGKRIGWL